MPRSRRGATTLAQDLLLKPTIGDDEVVAVLRKWHFGRNKIRTNVFPEGATSVHSDTLGLVRSRDGRVVVSRMTTKHSDVFRLLCTWLRDQLPALCSMPFVFTSISVNFGYAARKHRDGNNVGPSMTKSFGNFAGGGLKYWPNDDGLCNLGQLHERNAMHVDTKR